MSTTSKSRLTNLATAFALRLSDRVTDISDTLMPRHETGRAIAYIGRTKGGTVRSLSQHIGLSHAAAVRLVDRLSHDRLVRRQGSDTDRRAVALTLTDNGMAVYHAMLALTSDVIERALLPLSDLEKDALASAMAKVLANLETTPVEAAQGCRFCDVAGCDNCPVRVS